MAQHGDDVRATKKRVRDEGIESEKLGFQRDANTRAGAAEGRAAEGNEYEKGRRKVKEEADELSLGAARFKNSRMPIEAQHQDEDQQFQRNEQVRADKRLKHSEMQLAIQKMVAEINAGQRKATADRAAEDQRIQRGNQQSAFDQRNSPMNAAAAEEKRLRAIIAASEDDEEIAQAEAELQAITGDMNRERALREVKRGIASGRQ